MTDRPHLRLFVLRVLVLSIFLTLFGRLWFLQVHAGEDYDLAASANRVREVVVPAPRGEVLDATGTELVRNRTALVVSVNRALLLREPDDGKAVIDRLAALIGKPAEAIAREIRPCGDTVQPPCWSGSPYQPVPVQEYAATDPAGMERVLAIEEHREDFPGVTTELAAVRDYPQGTLGAHVLGYLGPISEPEVGTAGFEDVRADALVGRAGVEASYDAALRGRDGVEKLLVDHVGRVTGKAGETAPRTGDTLVLSLHAGVQQAAEQALQRAVDTARARQARGGSGLLRADSGSIVVMEAKTGRIVAMASYPSYDPAVFVGGATPEQFADLVDEGKGAPLVFRAIQGGYAPASTFKPISTAAAVMSGDYPLRGRYPCPGSYAPLGGKRNFEGIGLGTIDLRTALVKSCDTIFYKFAYEQWLRDGGNDPVAEPRDPMVAMAQGFGLGEPTGVDLPSERSGTIADRAFLQRRWEETKDNRCAGAVNPELTEQRRRLNREFCEDGNRFRGGDAANFAIGQGDTLVTPLQLATVYAALANGGQLVTPHIGRALLPAHGQPPTEIAPPSRGSVPVSPEVLDYMTSALAGVTQPGGTAAGAFAGFPVPVAGKTGTGEVAGKQDTSLFASFAPADAPELVVVGMVSQGGTGSTIAAPMVREVYNAIFGTAGHPALLPNGRLPDALPTRRPDGSIAPPGEVAPS